MGLSPNTIYEMRNQGLTQKASEEGARDCIACGSCSYICPAGINLTDKIAAFAGEGRVIEVNSLLYNSGHTATEGELIYNQYEENLCRTQVMLQLSPSDTRYFLTDPIGNHHIILPGHHKALLEALL